MRVAIVVVIIIIIIIIVIVVVVVMGVVVIDVVGVTIMPPASPPETFVQRVGECAKALRLATRQLFEVL